MESDLRLSMNVRASEYHSQEFHQLMVNRMIVSHHKYGKVADNYPTKQDAIKSLEQRLRLYKKTGNTEWLVDVANFCMIEFMRPKHPKAHFRATESKESPGLR